MKNPEKMTPSDFLNFFENFLNEITQNSLVSQQFRQKFPELSNFEGGTTEFLTQLTANLTEIVNLFNTWKILHEKYKKEWLSQVVFNYHSLATGNNT